MALKVRFKVASWDVFSCCFFQFLHRCSNIITSFRDFYRWFSRLHATLLQSFLSVLVGEGYAVFFPSFFSLYCWFIYEFGNLMLWSEVWRRSGKGSKWGQNAAYWSDRAHCTSPWGYYDNNNNLNTQRKWKTKLLYCTAGLNINHHIPCFLI